MRYVYQESVQDKYGRAVSGATVTVTLAGGSTAASIYTAFTGGTVDADGIITTGDDGSFEFFVDEDDYSHSQQFRIVWAKSGFTSETWDYQQIFPDGDRTLLTSATVDQGDSSIVGTLAWHIADASGSSAKIKVLSGSYLLTTAITISQDDTTVEFVGDGKITLSSDTTDAIVISGDRCKIIRPYFEGNGTYHRDGTGSKMLNITGDNCEVSNGHFVNPSGYGIYTNGVTGGKIVGNLITGGPTTGAGTSHAGIWVAASDDVAVSYNRIIGGATNKPVQGILLSLNSSHLHVAHNHIEEVWDEGIYHGSGTHCHFDNNTIIDSGCDGVGGMKVTGDFSSASFNTLKRDDSANMTGLYVEEGNYQVVIGNKIYDSYAQGILIRRPNNSGTTIGTRIIGNTIDGFGELSDGIGGIEVQSANTTEITHITISDNFVTNGNSTNETHGIYIPSTQAPATFVKVTGNTVDSVGMHGIFLWALDSTTNKNNEIKDNTITKCGTAGAAAPLGMKVDSWDASFIGNRIRDPDGNMDYGIRLYDLTSPYIRDNDIADYNIAPFIYVSMDPNQVICDQVDIYYGDLAAGSDDEFPIFVSPGPNGAYIIDAIITVGTTIAPDATDFRTFRLNDRDVNGSTSNKISDFDTDSGNDNVTVTAYIPLSFDDEVEFDLTHRILPKGHVCSFYTFKAASGVAVDGLQITLKYVVY